jgi:hypothetical protein
MPETEQTGNNNDRAAYDQRFVLFIWIRTYPVDKINAVLTLFLLGLIKLRYNDQCSNGRENNCNCGKETEIFQRFRTYKY